MTKVNKESTVNSKTLFISTADHERANKKGSILRKNLGSQAQTSNFLGYGGASINSNNIMTVQSMYP